MIFKCARCDTKFSSWDEYEHHRCPNRNGTAPEPSKHVQQAILQDTRSRPQPPVIKSDVPAPNTPTADMYRDDPATSGKAEAPTGDGKADADVPDTTTMNSLPPDGATGNAVLVGTRRSNPRGDVNVVARPSMEADVAALQALLDRQPMKKSQAARALGWSDSRLGDVLDRVPGLRSARAGTLATRGKRGPGPLVWFTTRTPDPPKPRTDAAVNRLLVALNDRGPMTPRSLATLLGNTLQHVSMLVARADGVVKTATRDTVRGRFSYYYVGELPDGFMQPKQRVSKIPRMLVVRIEDPDTIEQFMAIQAALDSNRDATLQCIIEGQYNDLASKGELKQ